MSKKDTPTADSYEASPTGVDSVKELIEAAKDGRAVLKRKSRIMFVLFILLIGSMLMNFIQYQRVPEPRLFAESPDSRIRELPLLHVPIYNNPQIIDWAESCITNIYNLTYLNWEEHVEKQTPCLSDQGRADFYKSLKSLGVTDLMNTELQGIVYAIPQGAVIRSASLTPNGYMQWIVEVPFRLMIDGKRKGNANLVMQMQIRRVSMMFRDDGLWIERYIVKPWNPQQ